MAIQNRRGAYADFDPQKMVAGEWAVVQSGDPNSTRGRAIYMAFDVGVIERMATYEDMQENIVNATSDVQEQFTQELTAAINNANTTISDIQDDADELISTSQTTVNNLVTSAQSSVSTAVTAANTATASANSAANRANDAIQAIQDILDSDSAVLSWNGRTGEVVPTAGDYSSAQISHNDGTVATALTFDSSPTAGSTRAVQSGGVYTNIQTLTTDMETISDQLLQYQLLNITVPTGTAWQDVYYADVDVSSSIADGYEILIAGIRSSTGFCPTALAVTGATTIRVITPTGRGGSLRTGVLLRKSE